MIRTILGTLAGVLVAWVLIALSQFLSASLYRPTATDLRSPESLADFIAAAPPLAMACVVAGYALAALAGGWTAARIGRAYPRTAAMLVGTLVLAGVVANFAMILHPAWMVVAGLLLPLPAAWWGSRLARTPARS
ncbi:MAG: hypothetical protein M3Q40_04325 [Pseudomonadota bacterium]|nr:hypothetical protein [Pseudomonadota bacterium]